MSKKITLLTVSWNVLKQSLAAPGWATTNRDIFIAGKIDDEDKIKIEVAPSNIQDQEAWGNVPIEIEWTDKEIETIKRCLNFVISKGFLFPNKFTRQLLLAFLVED